MKIIFPRIEHAYREFLTRVTTRDRRTLSPAQATRQPVLLVAGWAASARGWVPFKRFLEARGHPVYLPSDTRNVASVETMAVDIARRIRAIRAQKITVVAHSLGGLVLLTALTREPDLANKISRIVLLGTPLRGTIVGWVAPWEQAFPYLRFERRLRRLVRDCPPALKKKIHSLTARVDWVVFPRPHLAEAAENAIVPVAGHLALVLHPTAWEAIARRLW